MRCDVTKKTRRKFSAAFKREAVALFRRSGKGVTAIGREIGVRPNVLSAWVKAVEAEEKTGLTPDEVDELKLLRKENERLRMEVDILGKATAFFANRSK
jgi:transposase